LSHEILGKRFIARSKPAWHEIADEIFPEDADVTATEAMAKVAGDVDVDSRELYYQNESGAWTRAAKHVAIVRGPLKDDPKDKVFGVTSEGWVHASYKQLAAPLDAVSEKYKVETAALLKDGGLAFICFRAPDWAVKGDEMRSYLTANFSLTPGTGHRLFTSNIRTVCWNTNTMGQSYSRINLAVPHTADALQKIELTAALVTEFEATQHKAKEVCEAFADRHVSREEAQAIFEAAFPKPNVPAKLRLFKDRLSDTEFESMKRGGILTPDLLMGLETAQEKYDKDCETAEALQRCAYEQFEAFEPSRLGGTAWAAYNACTEVSDWREGRNAASSALFGSRAQEKSRAFAAAATLVKKR